MKNVNPLVTVLLPVYNGEKYIRESIQSVLNQTFINFELLIINDGSTDKTVEIINSFKDKKESEISINNFLLTSKIMQFFYEQ